MIPTLPLPLSDCLFVPKSCTDIVGSCPDVEKDVHRVAKGGCTTGQPGLPPLATEMTHAFPVGFVDSSERDWTHWVLW